MNNYLPTLPQISRETIAVIAATIIAAWVITRFPSIQRLVNDGSVTIKT